MENKFLPNKWELMTTKQHVSTRIHHQQLMRPALENGTFTERPTFMENGVEVTLTPGEVRQSENGDWLPSVEFTLKARLPFSVEIHMKNEVGMLEKIHPLDDHLPQAYSAKPDMRKWPDPKWEDECPGLLEEGDEFNINLVLLNSLERFYWKVKWSTKNTSPH